MGLETRRTSGKQINGSTLIVPGQPMLSYKKFENSFSYKRKAEVFEGYPVENINQVTTTTTTQTPI